MGSTSSSATSLPSARSTKRIEDVPVFSRAAFQKQKRPDSVQPATSTVGSPAAKPILQPCLPSAPTTSAPSRSEEHTSELQSRFDLVCRLLLEKKKKISTMTQCG